MLAGAIAIGYRLLPAPAGAETNPAIAVRTADFPGATGSMRAYVARQGDVAKAPGIVLIHGEQGLTPFFEDLARRLAAAGFVVAVPDLLSPLGGTPADPRQAGTMIGGLNPDDVAQNLVATMTFLAGERYAADKTGAVGFGWGGGMALRLASRAPALDAVVAFNPPPDTGKTDAIRAPVLLHQVQADRERHQAEMSELERSLKRAGVPQETFLYQSAVFDESIQRVPVEGFSGSSGANSGGASARPRGDADLALARTVAFLRTHLGT